MKRTVLTLTLSIALLAGFAAVSHAETLSIGDSVPMKDYMMKSVNGSEVSIADVAGKNGALVIFTCNTCPWVQAWESRIAAIGKAAEEKGIGVILVNSNDPGKSAGDGFEHMKKRAREVGYTVPYTVDKGSKLAKTFGATRTPEAFLFDAEGKLRYHGTIDDNAQEPKNVEAQYLRDAVNAVAGGEKVPERKTKALGCSIKWYS